MPSLHYTPLKGIALQEFYNQQEIEKHRDDEGVNYDRNPTISVPIWDCVVSSRKEDPASPAGNYASDCDTKRKEDKCTYTYKSNHVYNDTKRGEESYMSDTILDEDSIAIILLALLRHMIIQYRPPWIIGSDKTKPCCMKNNMISSVMKSTAGLALWSTPARDSNLTMHTIKNGNKIKKK